LAFRDLQENSMAVTAMKQAASMTEEEWKARVDLAASYRLIDYFGWADIFATHVSARVPGSDLFLANPQGMLFDEVTASSIVKVDAEGNNVGSSPYGINRAAFAFHSSVHRRCEHAAFVMHAHTVEGIAVSAQSGGLAPITIQSLGMQRDLAYYEGRNLPNHPGEYEQIAADIGARKMLVMRNHGLLTAGRSAGEAFLALYRLQQACEIQVAAQASPAGLHPMSESVIKASAARTATFDRGPNPPEWAPLLRKLDRLDPSYKE
jgi:ribulose-5-phosphate 4-epimerase/fuculose-1-phosphate aldolase